METLFAGIPLGEVSTSMTINSPAAMLLAFYACVGEEQGVPLDALRGTVQTDILKEYIAQKEWIFPPAPSMRLVVDMIEWCSREMPLMHPVSISGYHIREAGSTAAQELAFTLADGFAYVEACIERGLDVDDFAPRLSFFFNAHLDFFEEIAKYRAARRIWATRMRDKYGAKDPRSWLMRFHTQTAGVSLTAQQPEVNLIRTAIEALAAVLGGTQSLHTNSLRRGARAADRARGAARAAHAAGDRARDRRREHDRPARRLLLRRAADERARAAGVRLLRADREARRRHRRRSRRTSSSARSPRRAFRYQSEVERGQRVVVGVNRYQLEDEQPLELLRSTRRSSRSRSSACRRCARGATRAAVEPALARLKEDAARRGPQPDGADHGRLPRLRDDGRDVRRAPRGLGHLARDAGVLDESRLTADRAP